PRAAQRLGPSKAGICTAVPTVTVSRIAPSASTLRIVPGPASETQMFEPSKTTPLGDANPVDTVVAVQGIEAVGVTIEMEEPKLFAVQTRSPSKAAAVEPFPRLLATVVTAPAGPVGVTRERRPGNDLPATRTLPMATSAPPAEPAPVQVSRSLPSLARTRETVLSGRFGTHTSAPSERGTSGPAPTVVDPRTI